VNQAAINYHFGCKDGLYREVLRAAIRALTEHQLAHAEEMKGMSRENALVEFVKYQLRPLAARDQITQHYRLFNWETVRPTTVYRDIISEEATPHLADVSESTHLMSAFGGKAAIANSPRHAISGCAPPSRWEPRRVECVGDRIDGPAHSSGALDAPD
jgi:AcrR family transcriptional regulator